MSAILPPLLLWLACKPEAEPRQSPAEQPFAPEQVSVEAPTFVRFVGSPDLSRVPCFSRDSLAPNRYTIAYAYAVTDTEYTQDVAGEVFYLVLRDSAPAVFRREASGAWGAAYPVDSAIVDLGALTLWIRADPEYRLRGAFDCDSLWGNASIGVTVAPLRMRRADPYLPEAEAPN